MIQKTSPAKRGFLYSVFLFFFLFISVIPVFSEESLNSYYRYPFSLGAGYQSVTPIALMERKVSMNEISIHARLPLPFLPVLQPTLFGGVILADSDEKAQPTVLGGALDSGAVMPDYNEDDVWDHEYWFGALGAGYSHRVTREFELGADLFFGMSLSNFQKRVVTSAGEWYPVGEWGIVTGVSGRVSLNPSYNFSLCFSPSVRYARSIGSLHDFDGLYLGVSFEASYRFGKDPDKALDEIKSIRFSTVDFPPLYAAMQSYYARNPLGSVTILNSGDKKIENVEIFFYQAGFMDSPTPAGIIELLEKGEEQNIPLYASFNREVFSVEGITPLTGEIIVQYLYSGKPVEQRQPVSYDLHDKTAMTWDDDKKVAAFITPSDSALRNYTSFLRQVCREETVPLYNGPVQTAMQIYHGLQELGIMYQSDPVLPFTEAQDKGVVDSINLPRDTLKRITGDCDDLTVLFCSLLETVGIETGFITVPGHIYAAFNTKEKARNYSTIHTNRSMTISLDGEIWVPVEITMMGRSGFLDAWRKGSEEWNIHDDNPDARNFIITRSAQEEYRPVGLRETDLGLQYGNENGIKTSFTRDMDILTENIIHEYAVAAEQSGRDRDWNKLGVKYAQLRRYDQARNSFYTALRINPAYMSALINLSSLYFLQENYQQAFASYTQAAAIAEQKQDTHAPYYTQLLVNLSKTCYQLTRYDLARDYFLQAKELNPDIEDQYAYLAAKDTGDGTKAAETGDPRYDILFIEENE